MIFLFLLHGYLFSKMKLNPQFIETHCRYLIYNLTGYAEPVCTFTPVKTCKPRQVSKPRKVCQTVVDIYEDVVVTEKCREVVTTTCTQTTQTATHTSAVVDTSTNLVQAGVPKPPVRRRREAEAEAEAEAEPEAEADADAHYGAVIVPSVAVVSAPVVTTHEPVKSAGYPVCNSVPEKTCERIPTATPRNVARTVCDTVVDVTTIEDCTETVTKHCQHTSSSTSSSSKVVGSHSKVRFLLYIKIQSTPFQQSNIFLRL